MQVSVSAMGSVIMVVVVRGPLSVVRSRLSQGSLQRTTNRGQPTILLPTCVAHSGNQPLVCQLAEADAADAELAVNGPRPAAELATVFTPRAELGHILRFGNF